MIKQAPHGIEQGSILHDPQQLVGHGHIVGHRLLAVVEEGVWGPDLTGHQVVKRQDVHRSMELQPFILPALTEENVHSVFLDRRKRGGVEISTDITC